MVSSISAHVGAPTQVAYCGTKGAVSMLGKALGAVLGRHGIRVNVVEPGAVATPMSAGSLRAPDAPSRVSLPWYDGQVGPHIFIFEVCSAFTRVAACTLALPPIRDTLIEGFSHLVTSMTAPIASDGSELAGWGLHPLESAALSRRTPIADLSCELIRLQLGRYRRLSHCRFRVSHRN